MLFLLNRLRIEFSIQTISFSNYLRAYFNEIKWVSSASCSRMLDLILFPRILQSANGDGALDFSSAASLACYLRSAFR